ncbi:MAG: DNA-processing protein DprA [Paenibacillaceae bacterium]
MNKQDILFGLHETPGIGWLTILNLVSKCEDLTQLPQMEAADFLQMKVQANKVNLIHQACTQHYIEQRYELYRKSNYQIVTFFDDDYPLLMHETPQPPWILYVNGDIKLCKSPMMGMVGTRMPTTYGKRVAFQFAKELSEAGICVISGLARGIDSESHLGALAGEGKTIAILGTSLNEAYPKENEKLMKRIASEGAVISEFPLGTRSAPGLFPLRNRIIAGMSSGLIVVEADSKSGSLITAERSLEYGREVYAVPGPISSPKSRGTHELIKDGSRILTSTDEIIADFRGRKLVQADNSRYLPAMRMEEELTEDELHLIQFMSDEPINIDVLIEESGFDFGHFHSVLISLLMKKKIEQQFGSSYILLY